MMKRKDAKAILLEYPSMVVMPIEQIDYKEACSVAVKALEKMDALENLINTYKQKGHGPHYVITMEELAYLLDIREGDSECGER